MYNKDIKQIKEVIQTKGQNYTIRYSFGYFPKVSKDYEYGDFIYYDYDENNFNGYSELQIAYLELDNHFKKILLKMELLEHISTDETKKIRDNFYKHYFECFNTETTFKFQFSYTIGSEKHWFKILLTDNRSKIFGFILKKWW
jgi:signal peptidase I